MCGSNDFAKIDGFMVCQSCGTKFTVEDAKKMMVEVEGTVSVQGTVQIDKTSEVQKHLANARRALEKEDWDDVVRYYNLVEENDPTDIEAIFYSTYGKAKQTLTSDDFYKREQVFKSLINSISIIDDNFNLAKEQEQKEIIIKISQAILDMASSAYVYTEVRNGYGELKDSNSIKTRQLFNDLQDEFVRTIRHIATKYDDKSKTGYLYTVIIDQCNFILAHGQLVNPMGFRKERSNAVIALISLEPSSYKNISKSYVFTNENGVSCEALLVSNSVLALTTTSTEDVSFDLSNSSKERIDVIAFSLDDIDSLQFSSSDYSFNKDQARKKCLKILIYKADIGFAHISVNKDQFKLLRTLFEDIKGLVSSKCPKCRIEDIDNFSFDSFSDNQQIDKNAVMGLAVERVAVVDIQKSRSEVILNSDGTIVLKKITKGVEEKLYYWDILDVKVEDQSLWVEGFNVDGKRVVTLITFDDGNAAEIYTIIRELRNRILACGNKNCIFAGVGDTNSTMYPGEDKQYLFKFGYLKTVVLNKTSIQITRSDGCYNYIVKYQHIAGLGRDGNRIYIYYTTNGSIPSERTAREDTAKAVKEIWIDYEKNDVEQANKFLYEFAMRINYCKKAHGITFFTSSELYGMKTSGVDGSAIASKGPCYVATAVYGSYDCPQVWTLRRYRDEVLGSTWYGRLFIKLYYAISPTLVKWFGRTKWFQKMWKGKLDKMVGKLNAKGFDDTPYQDKNWK